MAQRLELRQFGSTSYPAPSPTVTQGTQQSWKASQDVAAPPQLLGGALGWKPEVGSALGEGGGGAGGFPAEAVASARPALRAQAQEAQGPRPDSRAEKGEVSGKTHPREKLLGNSGWPRGAGDAEAVPAPSPALSRLPSGPCLSLRLPQLKLSWRGSWGPARSEGTRPTSLPSGRS